MPDKIQIIIESYDPEEKAVEGKKIDPDQRITRFREKGYNVEEFKKLLRKKFGDGVEIINKVKKNRDMPFTDKAFSPSAGKTREEGLGEKDIVELMKNKFSD